MDAINNWQRCYGTQRRKEPRQRNEPKDRGDLLGVDRLVCTLPLILIDLASFLSFAIPILFLPFLPPLSSSSSTLLSYLSIDACVDLTVNATHSCVSYQGHMSGSVIGPKDTSGFNDIIRGHIESGAVTAGTSMNAAFVDFIIEADQTNSGADNLPPAINIPEPVQEDFRRSRTITPIGGMLVVGLALGVIGIVLVLVQMRRRRSQMLHEEVIMATRSHDLTTGDFSNGKDDPDSPRDVTSTYMDEGYGDTGPLTSPPAHFENQYTFDVGNLMKSELMGRHNNSQHPSLGGSVNRRELSGRGLDESDFSESDVDSWAQTDATLGSIEHRLEPITAEV